MEEMIDIVDDELNILYQTSKAEAHKKGLLHKCVIGEVINSKGEIMLIKPYSHKQDAGQFVSPMGGHVVAGESSEEALRREVMEELGISKFEYKFKGRGIFNRYVLGRHENHYFLLYEAFTDAEPVLGDEAESFERFTIQELKNRLKANRKEFGEAYLFIVRKFYPELLI